MRGWTQADSDFPNYYTSAQMLKEKNLQGLYDKERFQANAEQYNKNAEVSFLMYPPLTSALLIPLTWFDILTAKRIWLIFSLLLIFLIAKKTSAIFSLPLLTTSILTLCCGFNLANEIMLGQTYLLMLFLFLLGYSQVQKGDNWLSALLFAIVISIKFIPLVIIPILMFAERWRLILNMIIFTILLQLLFVLYAGIDVYKDFFEFGFSNFVSGKVVGEKAMALQYQSFGVLVNHIVGSDIYDASKVALGFLMKALFIGGLVLLFFRVISKTRFTDYLLPLGCGSAIITILLLENGSASYHFLFLLFPIVAITSLKEVKEKHKQILWFAFALVGFGPTIFSKLISGMDVPLLLSFPRFFALIFFYALWMIVLHKTKLKEHNPSPIF